MMALPNCPICNSDLAYEDGALFVCPDCAHDWPKAAAERADDRCVVRDPMATILADGDTVTVIKALKVKGASLVVKLGTKVQNIRLVDGDHDIDCMIGGIGAMGLKSELVTSV